LCFNGSVGDTEALLDRLMQLLTALEITSGSSTSAALASLQELNVSECFAGDTYDAALPGTPMDAFVGKCSGKKEMKVLDISGNMKLTGEAFDQLPDHSCAHLQVNYDKTRYLPHGRLAAAAQPEAPSRVEAAAVAESAKTEADSTKAFLTCCCCFGDEEQPQSRTLLKVTSEGVDFAPSPPGGARPCVGLRPSMKE